MNDPRFIDIQKQLQSLHYPSLLLPVGIVELLEYTQYEHSSMFYEILPF